MSMIKYDAIDYSAVESEAEAKAFYDYMDKRRSIREFSDQPVSKKLIENLILTASSEPSGAHKQPWTFVAVSNAEMKTQIRKAAEEEEFTNYNGRMSEEWLRDLAVFQTNWEKEFLEIAPWLIVVFKKAYDLVDGEKQKNYYVNESVGIACGFLLAAIHKAGLVSLTHTPSPMNFLQKLLGRPENERAFLLIPVGYPAKNTIVPNLERKALDEMTVWFE